MAEDRPIVKKVGENLRNLRLSLKYSQSDMAKTLGLTQAAISHFEAGDRAVDLELLFEISEKFHIPVTDLVPVEQTHMADDISVAVSSLIKKNPSWLNAIGKAKLLTDHETDLVINMIDCLSKRNEPNG